MTMKKYVAVALSQGTIYQTGYQTKIQTRHQTRKILAILTFKNHNS